jgi:diguanylate cyclase (GGDEF)-like protein
MSASLQRRRVVLAAGEGERRDLRKLFASEALRHWDVVEADSLERARFLRQLEPADVLLVGAGLASGFDWLGSRPDDPVLFVADAAPEAVEEALRQGAHGWLPRSAVMNRPGILAAGLERLTALRDCCAMCAEALRECRRRTDRLTDLLWQAVPGEGPECWLTQRHVLERLSQEVARSQRHGTPLSVILGELEMPAGIREGSPMPSRWMAERVSEAKRRSDAAGQYGLSGFLMVLPQTPEAGAVVCCRRLRQLLCDKLDEDGSPPRWTTHLGIATLAPHTNTISSLLRHAEESLDQDRTATGDPG